MEIKSLLKKSVWTINDMKSYLAYREIPCAKTKLYSLFKFAKTDLCGEVELGPRFVKRDSVLALFGTNLEKELREWELMESHT